MGAKKKLNDEVQVPSEGPTFSPGEMQRREIIQKEFTIIYYEQKVTNEEIGYDFDVSCPSLIICLEGDIMLGVESKGLIKLLAKEFVFIVSSRNSNRLIFRMGVPTTFLLVHFSHSYFNRLDKNEWVKGFQEELDKNAMLILPLSPRKIGDTVFKNVQTIIKLSEGCEKSKLVYFHLEKTVRQLLRALFVGKGKLEELIPDYERIMAIKHYLNLHFCRLCNPHQIAKDSGLTELKMFERFKKITGHTAIQFIINSRVEKAKTLLIDIDLPIAEISQLVGYEKMNELHRVFIKAEGIGPREYRKRWQKQVNKLR